MQLTVHCAKNFLAESLTKIRVPLILGVWGGKGQGKTFQVLLFLPATSVCAGAETVLCVVCPPFIPCMLLLLAVVACA